MRPKSRRQQPSPPSPPPAPAPDPAPTLLTADGFVDTLKGLGEVSGTTSVSRFASIDRQLSVYEDLYEHDWLARRIVQIFPEDALRKRPTLDGIEADESTEIWERFDELNSSLLYPQGILAQGLFQGRALAGSIIILGPVRGELHKPRTDRAELAWLDVVPWKDLSVQSWVEDRNKANHGQPEVVRVSGDHPRHGAVIHLSHTIPCEGLARATWVKGDDSPWISVLQPVYEVVRDYGLSWEAASLLLQEASVGVLKMQGLVGMLASRNEDTIKARMRLVSAGRSTARTVFLDAEGGEDFKRTEVTFTGVDRILEQLQMRICGAAKVPHTRLFGRSPDGMSATGESDMRNFYDEVSQYQTQAIQPKLQRLLSLIAGKPIKVIFPPLQEPSAKEAAELRKANAEADAAYYDLGVLEPGDIATSRTADGSLGVTIEDLTRFEQTPPAPTEPGGGTEETAAEEA